MSNFHGCSNSFSKYLHFELEPLGSNVIFFCLKYNLNFTCNNYSTKNYPKYKQDIMSKTIWVGFKYFFYKENWDEEMIFQLKTRKTLGFKENRKWYLYNLHVLFLHLHVCCVLFYFPLCVFCQIKKKMCGWVYIWRENWMKIEYKRLKPLKNLKIKYKY